MQEVKSCLSKQPCRAKGFPTHCPTASTKRTRGMAGRVYGCKRRVAVLVHELPARPTVETPTRTVAQEAGRTKQTQGRTKKAGPTQVLSAQAEKKRIPQPNGSLSSGSGWPRAVAKELRQTELAQSNLNFVNKSCRCTVAEIRS